MRVCHKKWRHPKCICDVLDEACSLPPIMTPQPLMCYASHLVTIWAWLSSCVFLGSSGSIASAKGYMTEGWGVGGGGGEVALLDASSAPQMPEDVILIYICWGHLFPLPDYLITTQKGDRGNQKYCRCECIYLWHYWCIFLCTFRLYLLQCTDKIPGVYHRIVLLNLIKAFDFHLNLTCGKIKHYLIFYH